MYLCHKLGKHKRRIISVIRVITCRKVPFSATDLSSPHLHPWGPTPEPLACVSDSLRIFGYYVLGKYRLAQEAVLVIGVKLAVVYGEQAWYRFLYNGIGYSVPISAE